MAEHSSCSAAKNTDIGAGLPAATSCDMEEGELPDSEDEISCNEPKHKSSPAYVSFRKDNYRSVIETDEEDDDSESDEGSSSWKRKKQKICKPQRCEYGQDIENDSLKQPVIPKSKKVNNIWGAVIQEQNEHMVSTRLTTVGLDFSANRGVESYNHQRSLETETVLPFGSQNSDALPNRNIPQAFVEDDDWLEDRIEHTTANKKDIHDDIDGAMDVGVKDVDGNNTKLKAKQRLGKRPQHLPSVIARKMHIDPSDGIKIVAGKIAYCLWEPKRHLIQKTVEIIGTEKSTEIYNKVIEIEESGGMMIMSNQRRRSPGGVFIYLLRNSYGIEKQLLDEIFDADADYQRNGQKEKKDKKKRKQTGNKNIEVSD